jgi:hypothetical protein
MQHEITDEIRKIAYAVTSRMAYGEPAYFDIVDAVLRAVAPLIRAQGLWEAAEIIREECIDINGDQSSAMIGHAFIIKRYNEVKRKAQLEKDTP